MNLSTPTINTSSSTHSQRPSLPTSQHNYARMSHRRAIACTICAKAKTKCDKLVPSCSRCTAKGLQCEPRSTRRTSDSSYRTTAKKHIVSPKRFPSTNSVPTLSRHGSPRSVPTSNRHQLVRAKSHMDMVAASKLHQRQNYSGMPLFTGFQGYTPQIVDEYYSDYSGPEPTSAVFAPATIKTSFLSSGRLTPQTPDSFPYNEALTATDPFDQYTNCQAWSDDGLIPIGLGLEGDMPGMLLTEPNTQIWNAPELEHSTTSIQSMQSFTSPVCQSPASLEAWPDQGLSVSPPPLPHTRGVPSLSISESSAPEFEIPDGQHGDQDHWARFHVNNGGMGMAKPINGHFMDTIKMNSKHPQWEDIIVARSSTF